MRNLVVLFFIGIMTLSATIVSATPTMAASKVNLALVSATQTVITGETFDIIIQAQSENQEVVGIDSYLDFDPTKLAVVDMNSGKAGIQISGGTTLSVPLWNSANNTTGHIDYSAGSFNPYANGTFTIATIRFLALAATSPTTTVTFSSSFERPTMVIGDTQAINVTGTLTSGTYLISSENTPALSGISSSGSGGESGKTLNISGLSADKSLTINSNGVAQNSVQLITTDRQAVLNIAAGTTLLNSTGNPLSILIAEATTTIPPVSPNNYLISAYTFGPSGASFNPAIVLSLSYNPTVLPEGIVESSLYIAYYDGASWLELESTVDPTTNTVNAKINHLSSYALMAKFTAVTTSIPQDPLSGVTAGLEEPRTTLTVTATTQTSDVSTTPIETATPGQPPIKEQPPTNSDKYALIIFVIVAVMIISLTSVILVRRNHAKNKP